ncbi:acetyltransferase [Rufibacter latericius]|uniref:Acetyltransferase n=1 Tax=Rufibacter latericius TaxID=2487040 RepID=A0A3M9N366_9BACT|nr:acetyltransferase [Rufibacter latericius]RNI31468.1 acetyltransferase [Rufibacter latericius]
MNNEIKRIAIVGAGGLGREVLMLLHQINHVTPRWKMIGFYDDASPAEPTICGFPYLGTVDELNDVDSPMNVVIAIGNCPAKTDVADRLISPMLHFPVLIHPSVHVYPEQKIHLGEGTIICQNCILTTNVTLGRHVLLNLACTIGHDTEIGDFCSLMPQVAVSGGVCLGMGVYGGTNSTILQNIEVGAFTTIGAGAVVTKELPCYCTAVGVPAQIIKQTA